jgi:hypothetical protein
MDKWDALRGHFMEQATELEEDDDYAIFALEMLDLMDVLEEQERRDLNGDNYEQTTV